MTEFAVYAAIADESNEGWIWLYSANQLPTRTIVKITNVDTDRSVYCVSRRVDENFQRLSTKQLPLDTVVMSQWYRDALGIVETTIKSGQRTRLTIRVPWQPWDSIRAACQHPDVVACIGTRLGVIGAWLGLIGLVPPAFISRGVKADEPIVGSAQL
jgi:hypothetical protein